MGLGGNITLLVLAALIVIISLILITDATVKVNEIDDYQENSDLVDASQYLTWMTVSAWIVLVLVAFGIGMLIYNGGSGAAKVGGIIVSALLVFMILILFVMGVMAALAADSIYKSGKSTSGNGKTAYNNCVVVAILSMTSIGLLIIMSIIYLVQRHKRAKMRRQLTEGIKSGDTSKIVEDLTQQLSSGKGKEKEVMAEVTKALSKSKGGGSSKMEILSKLADSVDVETIAKYAKMAGKI